MTNSLEVLSLWGFFILASLFFLNYFAGEPKVKTFSVFLLFLVFLSIVYFPGMTGHYLFHDDVYMWAWQKTNWASHFQYAQQGTSGRPLAKIIMFSMFSLVDTVNSANIPRFFTVIIISLVALSIHLWLRQVCSFGEKSSFLISVAIAVLPPFQVYVYWVTAFFIPVASLLSIFSAMLLLKPKVPLAVLFSMILLLCSLSTYQPGATFFIALAAIWLVEMDCRDINNIKRPWLHLAVFFMAVLVYSFFFKMLVPAHEMGAGYNYNAALTSDFAGKLGWFLRGPLVVALNLWHIFPSKTVAGTILLIIFGGIVLEFYSLMKQDNNNRNILARNLLLKYSAVLFLIILSFSLNLAVGANVFLYRTIAPLTAIVFLLFWNGIRRLTTVIFKQERYVKIVLLLICLGAMFYAHWTFRKYCVDNNARELKYIEDELVQKYNPNIHEIFIVKPAFQEEISDEFGMTTGMAQQDIPWLIKAALQERGIWGQSINIASGTSKDVIPQNPLLLVIDLNKI